MTGDEPTIAIEGTREDWPRRRSNPDAARPQPRTERADLLVRRRARPGRHPVEAVRWMREQTPGARGDRLVDVLLAWMPPDHGGTPARRARRPPRRRDRYGWSAPSCRSRLSRRRRRGPRLPSPGMPCTGNLLGHPLSPPVATCSGQALSASPTSDHVYGRRQPVSNAT